MPPYIDQADYLESVDRVPAMYRHRIIPRAAPWRGALCARFSAFCAVRRERPGWWTGAAGRWPSYSGAGGRSGCLARPRWGGTPPVCPSVLACSARRARSGSNPPVRGGLIRVSAGLRSCPDSSSGYTSVPSTDPYRVRGSGSANTNIAFCAPGIRPPPTGTARYCLPLTAYVVGNPCGGEGRRVWNNTSPVSTSLIKR